MTREQIEQRAQALGAEMQKLDEELAKLRPRVQYLEHMLLRADGALSVLRQLIDADSEEKAQGQHAVNSAMPQPVAS